MRCSSCGVDNSDDHAFCEDCGAALRVACAACGAPLAGDKPFCGACGAPRSPRAPAVQASAAPPEPAPPSEERRLATVLFCDLAGFTSMSERMDPEDVKALATACTDLMREEVVRFGGTVTAIMGDAIMGLFGAPVAHEDDAERAVRAALSIRRRIGTVRGGPMALEVHAGINTGEIMAGVVGSSERPDYTAMGDTTNTAARLMSAAATGTILVGEPTYLATRHVVSYGEPVEITAKGKREPVPAREALDVAAVGAPRPLGVAPFVGRKPELAVIAELWGRVQRDNCVATATIVGPAGIGKTRFLHESVAALAGADQVYWGRCLAYGEGITYWPLMEIVKAAAGVLHDDHVTVASAKLGALLGSLVGVSEDEARSIAIAIANLLAVPVPPLAVEATPITKGELHWGVGRMLEALALGRPSVLVLEDLHWAEPTLLEFVTDLAGSSAHAPILVLATARPEVLAPGALPGGRDNPVLRLEGLDEDESRSILADLLGTDPQAARRIEALLRKAEGNPLFLEETVRMLANLGPSEDGNDDAEVPVPSSVQGLIGARLDQLPTEHRRLAQRGSVLGQTLWPGAVSHVSGSTVGVDAGLEGLVAREVLELHDLSSVAGELEYGFRHVLIRDVAYGRLPRGERSVLHDRCADWIAELPGGRDEMIELVAYHLEQACVLAPALGPAAEARPVRRAADALVDAAEKAEHREGIREAHRFYARALDVVGGELPELATELRLKRARMTAAQGELALADEELRVVVDEARRLGRPDLRGHALVALANVHLKLGRAKDAGAWLAEARDAALETDDRRLQVRAAYEFSALRGDFEGDAEGAIAELHTAVTIADELGDRTLVVEGLLREGNLLVNLGLLADAASVVHRCAELASQLESRRDEARATFLLALVTYYRTGPADAEVLGLRAHEWLRRIGDGYFLPQSLRALAKYALSDGRPELAEERLIEALSGATPGGGWVVVELCRYLTEALVDQGRVDDALAAAARARDAVPEEDEYARAAALLATALAAAAASRADEAWPDFVASIAIMEGQQLWIDAAEAACSTPPRSRPTGATARPRPSCTRPASGGSRWEATPCSSSSTVASSSCARP